MATSQTESAKSQSSPTESPTTESPKSESPKSELSKGELPKSEPPPVGSAHRESSPGELPRSEPPRAAPPAPEPTVHLSVPAEAVERILAALQAISSGPGYNTNTSSSIGDNRVPTVPQSRTILDYAVVSQLLGRARFNDGVVRASRLRNVITFFGVPAGAVGAAVLGAGDRDPEVVAFEATYCSTGDTRTVTLHHVRDDQAITRVELLDADGRPIRLGPRLPAQ